MAEPVLSRHQQIGRPNKAVVCQIRPATPEEAAKVAGAKCIAVTNSTTAANLSQADLVCDSLKQIDLETI